MKVTLHRHTKMFLPMPLRPKGGQIRQRHAEEMACTLVVALCTNHKAETLQCIFHGSRANVRTGTHLIQKGVSFSPVPQEG